MGAAAVQRWTTLLSRTSPPCASAWQRCTVRASACLNVDSSGDYRVAKAIPDDPGVDMQWDGQTTVRTWGLIGAPGVSRSTRANQHLFVNRRPIENRSLNRALIEGYHTALMKGQFPLCCLFIEIAPAEVDVNIHPAKREVKFHHERDVRRLLTQAVQETLLAFHSQKPKSVLTPADEAVDVTPISPVAIPVQAELGDQSPTAALDQAQPGPPQNESVRTTARCPLRLERRCRCCMCRCAWSAWSANCTLCSSRIRAWCCWISTPRTRGCCTSRCSGGWSRRAVLLRRNCCCRRRWSYRQGRRVFLAGRWGRSTGLAWG